MLSLKYHKYKERINSERKAKKDISISRKETTLNIPFIFLKFNTLPIKKKKKLNKKQHLLVDSSILNIFIKGILDLEQ